MSEYKRNPRGARRARKSMGRKAIVVLSLMMVLVLATVGGTIAWLTAQTGTVTNTFTVGDIGITLEETLQSDGTTLEANETWSAQLVPSKNYTKDPVVAVDVNKTNVPIYLFVKFEEINTTNNGVSVIEYDDIFDDNDEWTPLTGDGIPTTVYYRIWDPEDYADDPDSYPATWKLLNANEAWEGKEVHIPDSLNVANMPATGSAPQLKFTAYAIQVEGSNSAAEAWTKLNPTTTTP